MFKKEGIISLSWEGPSRILNLFAGLSIFRFGPLVRHWTMRYEAKHSYFKQLAQSMGNFINLPYSLAMRHQQLQCYWSINDKEIPGTGLTVGPGMCIY